MRISTHNSLRLRPKAARRKKSMQNSTRKKSETEFAKESRLLILITRITRAQSKEATGQSVMKSTPISLALWSLQMTDRIKKGLVAGGLFTRGLIVRGATERDLIDQGNTEKSLNMMSLGIATMTQK